MHVPDVSAKQDHRQHAYAVDHNEKEKQGSPDLHGLLPFLDKDVRGSLLIRGFFVDGEKKSKGSGTFEGMEFQKEKSYRSELTAKERRLHSG